MERRFEMIEGLFQEGDEETILAMDFDDAVPALMMMFDINEDDAFEMWKARQREIAVIEILLWEYDHNGA
jgi:hypothetical protein